VWAYAESAFSRASGADVDELRGRLARFLNGDPAAPRYKDGYSAVAELLAGLVDEDDLSASYQESRKVLAAGEVEISTPAGLRNFLSSLAGKAERVLVTNAPLDGVQESLQALDLTDVIDSIRSNANKPSGFTEILPQLLANRSPEQLVSIGDVYANDIELPLNAGCVTAYIDRFNHRTGPAHLRAATFEQMYADLLAWAENPLEFIHRYAPSQ
jgi:FMN phosphatase YigB (HAD superfamily)